MSRKFRLFAGVAVPLLSLPAMLLPAFAAPPLPVMQQGDMPNVVQIQQPAVVPPGDDNGDPKDRRKKGQQDGGERPVRPQRNAQGADDGASPERPQRNQPRGADQNDGAPQRPQRQTASPDRPEKPARQPQAAGDQQEAPVRPRRQQNAEDQQPGTPVRPPRQQNADDQQPGTPGRPPRQQNADDQQPGTPVRPQRQQNADDQQPGTPGRPPRQPADDVRPGDSRPVDPQQAGSDRRPAPPRSPEQVERARQIAKDPRGAKDGEQVVLPVENGAAVLDSEKRPTAGRDRNDQGRPPRNPSRDQADRPLAPPKSDADSQAGNGGRRFNPADARAANEERGERLDRRPQFERPRGWGERDNGGRNRDDGRVIITIDDQPVVRHDDSRRFYRDGREPEYDRLNDGRVREVIVRDDGTRVVTIRNRYGEVVQRSRIVRGGNEYVLYYAPELANETRGPDYVWRDPGDDLPPMRLSVPVDDYIIDTSSQPDRDYYRFLEQPPVENVERVYSLDEVRYSARIRDKVRRIDLDTITFATGSADIPMNQASSLRKVADAINKVLQKDPSETFLIEGHTDAVGSDDSNLVLSDQRAESVARVLSDAFGIPPENLTTQGYGEQFLKVQTDGPNEENRRVTIRRITALVRPVASNR